VPYEVSAACVFVGEGYFPLADRHLVDWFGLLVAGHRGISLDGYDYNGSSYPDDVCLGVRVNSAFG